MPSRCQVQCWALGIWQRTKQTVPMVMKFNSPANAGKLKDAHRMEKI